MRPIYKLQRQDDLPQGLESGVYGQGNKPLTNHFINL